MRIGTSNNSEDGDMHLCFWQSAIFFSRVELLFAIKSVSSRSNTMANRLESSSNVEVTAAYGVKT